MPLPLDESDPIGIHRYQLTVVAADMTDVVQSTGGWLCDRARAGWDVNVLVADHRDARPLSILGATALVGDDEFWPVLTKSSQSAELAISSHVLATDDRVRADVLRVVKRGVAVVTVWGDDWPAEFGRKVDQVEHKLSSAARAFKAHALRVAGGSTGPVTATETFFNLDAESFRPLYSV